MARSDFGSSGFGVQPTDRVAETSFYDQRDRENRDRRRRQSARPHHATLIDLLFEEVEPSQERQEESPKRQPRQRPPQARPVSRTLTASQHPPEPHPEPHPQIPLEPDEETDRRVRLAEEEAEEELRIDEKIREARQVSTQLRYCLSQHTETARKVSSYLHALLMITHGSYKPKLVIEV